MKLSIVTSPNRHGFCEGVAWDWFKEKVLTGVDYELINTTKPTPPTGQRVLLMGQAALRQWGPNDADLYKARGTLLNVFGKDATCTFDVQDAYDFKSQETDTRDENSKDTTSTRKQNWFFWIEADTRKILRSEKPKVLHATVHVKPVISTIIASLVKCNNKTLYLDIECDMASDTLTCVGFAVDESPVFVVPIYRYDGTLAYDRKDILRFLWELGEAFTRNKVVIHNSQFDLAYLTTKYRIKFGKDIFDTMLAHQRCYSEIEKSLGHAISLWTWQPYHKDMGSQARSAEQERRMHQYNGLDVFSMRLVKKAIEQHAASVPGLAESIKQANASLYPYLLAGLHGFKVHESTLATHKVTVAAELEQLTRIMRIMTGDKKFNPDSPKQVVKYFHDKLCYKVMARSDSGAPSLGSKPLYQLALKYPNPLIQVLLRYRELSMESTMSTFFGYSLPWRREVEHKIL
jgi:DNA polymerase I-like protein with 3'-5' exonuclease and polymerase domains